MGSRSNKAKDLNTEQRIGGAKIRQAIYGRDSIGLRMKKKDRQKLLRSGGEDIVAGNKKAKEKEKKK